MNILKRLLFSLLLIAGVANAAVTQPNSGSNNSGSSVTLGSSASVGDLIWVSTQGGVTATITGTLNGVYTSVGSKTLTGGDIIHLAYVIVTVAGAETISSSGVSRIAYARYSTFTHGPVVIVTDTDSGTIGTSASLATTPFNASKNNEICYGAFDGAGGSQSFSGQFLGPLAGDSFLQQAETSAVGLISSGTSVTMTVGLGSSGSWGAFVGCFYDGATSAANSNMFLLQ